MNAISLDEQINAIFSGKYEALNAPEHEVEPGEVVLGTLASPKAQALFSILRDFGRRGNSAIATLNQQLGNSLTEQEKRLIYREHHFYHNRNNALQALFWEMVYDEYPAARDPGVTAGVRVGWKVVIFKSSGSSLSSLLGNVFGVD